MFENARLLDGHHMAMLSSCIYAGTYSASEVSSAQPAAGTWASAWESVETFSVNGRRIVKEGPIKFVSGNPDTARLCVTLTPQCQGGSSIDLLASSSTAAVDE
jgi:hypothetical protein